jgi:hypothetical protein
VDSGARMRVALSRDSGRIFLTRAFFKECFL